VGSVSKVIGVPNVVKRFPPQDRGTRGGLSLRMTLGAVSLIDVLMPATRVGPFERHLRDAIQLNRSRAPHYASLSDGASRPISRTLVAAELLLLPVARWFDGRAAPYHAAGIPLLEDLFAPMSSAPAIGSAQPAPEQREPKLPRVSGSAIRGRVLTAFRASGFGGAEIALARELATLGGMPSAYHVTRHLLESAYRLTRLAPGHIQRAESQRLPSPAPLLARLLRLHLLGLGPASTLDRRAFPLQARGIGILAQDLPPLSHDPANGVARGELS
jgi:hypothetical protein